MFEITKLKLGDLERLSEEPSNSFVQEWIKTGAAQQWVDSPECYSGSVHGELAMSWGLTKYWTGRAHIWTIFSERSARYFVSVFRGCHVWLRSTQYNRIEMDVPLDQWFSETAHRRALLWGFKLECPRAKAYRPNGSDSALYAWTRGT